MATKTMPHFSLNEIDCKIQEKEQMTMMLNPDIRKTRETKALPLSIHVFRVVLMALIIVAAALCTLGMWSECATGATFTDEGYINQLMTGDQSSAGGWDDNVISNVDPSLKGTTANSMTQSVSNFFLNLGLWIIGMGVVLCAARLAGRGICELLISDNDGARGKGKKKGSLSIPGFFLTSEERNSSPSPEWVAPMLRETGLFLGIALFVGAFISILAGIALMMIDEASTVTGLNG